MNKNQNKISVIVEYDGLIPEDSITNVLASLKEQSVPPTILLVNTSGLPISSLPLIWFNAVSVENTFSFHPKHKTNAKLATAQLTDSRFIIFDYAQKAHGPKFVERFLKQAEGTESFCIIGNQGFTLEEGEEGEIIKNKERDIDLNEVDFVQGSFLIKRITLGYLNLGKTFLNIQDETNNFPLFCSISCKVMSRMPVLLACASIDELENSNDEEVEYSAENSKSELELCEQFKFRGWKPINFKNEKDNSGQGS